MERGSGLRARAWRRRRVDFTSSFETAVSRPLQDEVEVATKVLILRSVALATRLEG